MKYKIAKYGIIAFFILFLLCVFGGLFMKAHGQRAFKSEYLDTSRVAVLKNDSLFVFLRHKEFSGLRQQGRQDTVICYNGKSYSFKYAVYDFGQFYVKRYSKEQVIRNRYANQ